MIVLSFLSQSAISRPEPSDRVRQPSDAVHALIPVERLERVGAGALEVLAVGHVIQGTP